MSDPKYFSFNHDGNEYTFNSNYNRVFINDRTSDYYLNKNINKLITFFDVNKDGSLDSYNYSKDVKSFF